MIGFRFLTRTLAAAWFSNFSAILVAGEPTRKVLAGNLCATSPMGMAVVIDRQAGFVIEPQWSDRPKDDAAIPPGTTAPDGSTLESCFTRTPVMATATQRVTSSALRSKQKSRTEKWS